MKQQSKMLSGRKIDLSIIKNTIRSNSLQNLILKTYNIIKKEGIGGAILRMTRRNHNDYAKWIEIFDTVSNEQLEKIKIKQAKFIKKPLISVILPVFNPKPEWLDQAIKSVCQQTYPNWELCIADDASTDLRIKEILTNYQNKDNRIKVNFRKKNGHIVACSNSAIEMAKGEWIALLDHDDMLSSTALYWVVEAINKFPAIKLIYSDEDKIDTSENRSSPYFKCDWNIDLFYSHNMFSHLGVYNSALINKVGKFREGYEGSQDYDLALRCIEHIEKTQIHHIPRVLYHWRIHNQSTAFSAETKPYAMLAGERAINDHFKRCNIQAKAQLIGYGYRVKYLLPDTPPLVSIIILTRNGFHLLISCIQSIEKFTNYPNYEIIVVDNGSDDLKTLEYLNYKSLRDESFRVLRIDRPFNYSELNNQAVKIARGEYIVLMNNDVKVILDDWLSELISIAIQPDVGVVGAKLYYPDDTIQHAGIVLGLGFHGVAGCAHNKMPKENKGYFGRSSLINSFSAVTAACMVIKKEIYEYLNGFNEINLPISYNDVDFCLRVRESGFRIIFTPYAQLYHLESATRGMDLTMQEQERFAKEIEYFKDRWSHLLLNDPAYNPNLTLEFSDFSLAWPPRIEMV